MANVKLLFCGTEESKTNDSNLEVLASSTEIILFLSNGGYESHICLDKTTAVRLVRELKKQIGFLESEFPTMQKGNYSILTKEVKKGGNTNG